MRWMVMCALLACGCGDDDAADASMEDTGRADAVGDSGEDGGERDAAEDASEDAADDAGEDDAGDDAGGDDAASDAGDFDSGLCEAIEAEYETTVTEGQRCEAPGTCVVLTGHCGIGLGACYYGASGVTQDELDAIAARWSTAGCTGPVCDCPAPPDSVRCDAGGCLLRF